MIIAFLLAFCIVSKVQCAYPSTTAYYANSKEFVTSDTLKLYWNYSSTEVIGELHAKTLGWVGFGLSANGAMDGADVFVAWIDAGGNVNFTDRYISGRDVKIDAQQDWKLLSGTRSGSYLIIKFSRKIQTCDPNGQDKDIENGTPKVIYAWNDAVPTGDISYHGATTRGAAVVTLLTALNQELKFTAADLIENYNYTVSITIPTSDTYYHCQMFKIPSALLTSKRHLLRTTTKITPGNENYFHHWLMYTCNSKYESVYLPANSNSDPAPGTCFSATWASASSYCTLITLVWAIGGDLNIDFPSGLGFPIGGSDREFTYFYLQMHYDNPSKLSGIADSSGIQLYMTPTLRATEVGIFTNMGDTSWKGILVPPAQTEFKTKYDCPSSCLTGLNQGSDVTIFAVVPHSHLIGTGIYSTLIRNGKEVSYIGKTLNYDFNYQYMNFLTESVIVKPGDDIQTTCIYKTSTKTKYTPGGTASSEEMWYAGGT